MKILSPVCHTWMMQKDFDRWNSFKKKVDSDIRAFDFHERELWWCSIGINIGTEQHSQTEDFSRPVLILKRFTTDTFWGIPLTTKTRDLKFRFRFNVNGMENDLLIFQMRAYDKKRLKRKIGMMNEDLFDNLKVAIKNLL